MGGKSIRTFLVDGTVTGLRTAEIGLSTCKAVLARRGSLAALLAREESKKTGVYVLVGSDPDATDGRLAIYVGEGDNVSSRIVEHDKDESKDFWDRVAIFVSKDDNLTKAHGRYLEAKLIEIASQVKRATVTNKTAPDGGTLPEADRAEMDDLIER